MDLEKAKEYLAFFAQMVSLQKRLVPVFEVAVEIEPIPPKDVAIIAEHYNDDAPNLAETMMELMRPDSTISEIIKVWPYAYPSVIEVVPMCLWLKPRTGIMRFEGKNWLFQMHGWNELGMFRLPSALSQDVIAAVKLEGNSALQDVPKSVWETDTEQRPQVDVTYLSNGRTDGVRPWAAYLYAQSVECKFRDFDQYDHERFLEGLVEEDFLEEMFGHYFIDKISSNERAA